jgi:hypothetical protein
MEALFKFLFALAVLIFCITIVGIFLLIIKIILLFQPQVYLMGVMLS